MTREDGRFPSTSASSLILFVNPVPPPSHHHRPSFFTPSSPPPQITPELLISRSRRQKRKRRGNVWLGRKWETLLLSVVLPFGSLPPSHTHTHAPTPPAHHHHHHWYPTENHDAAHLVCQPSHFRCRGNISQDGSSKRAHTPGIQQGLCLPPGTGKSVPRWQYRWH